MARSIQNALPSIRLQAAAVGLFTGILSAVTLNPLGEASEGLSWWPDELFGFLSVFAFSAGLIYGLFGGAFGRIRMAFSWPIVAAFLVSSMVGMAAAVYAAILTIDTSATAQSYVIPYLAGSTTGALVMAIPLAFLGRFEQRGRVILTATVLTTLWSGAVGGAMAVVGSDNALSIPWLIPLFAGWQALFLVVLAGAKRGA